MIKSNAIGLLREDKRNPGMKKRKKYYSQAEYLYYDEQKIITVMNVIVDNIRIKKGIIASHRRQRSK
jgi:hypothetical protein